jgi:hypothetical protein
VFAPEGESVKELPGQMAPLLTVIVGVTLTVIVFAALFEQPVIVFVPLTL